MISKGSRDTEDWWKFSNKSYFKTFKNWNSYLNWNFTLLLFYSACFLKYLQPCERRTNPSLYVEYVGHDCSGSPGQQGAEVIRRARIRAERRRHDKCSSFGPVFAPVVWSVRTQAGCDWFSVDDHAWKQISAHDKHSPPLLTISFVLLSRLSYPFSWPWRWRQQLVCSSLWWCREGSWPV